MAEIKGEHTRVWFGIGEAGDGEYLNRPDVRTGHIKAKADCCDQYHSQEDASMYADSVVLDPGNDVKDYSLWEYTVTARRLR